MNLKLLVKIALIAFSGTTVLFSRPAIAQTTQPVFCQSSDGRFVTDNLQGLILAPKFEPSPGMIYIQVGNGYLQAIAFQDIAEQYANAGDDERAFAIASQLSYGANALIGIACQFASDGRFEEAISLIEETPVLLNRDEDRQRGLSEIARQFAAAGRFEEALQIAQGLTEPLRRMNVLLAVAYQYAVEGHYEEAIALAEQMQGIYDSDSSYYRVVTLLEIANQASKAQQWTSATQSIDRALEIAETGSIQRHLEQIAQSYAAAQQFDRAIAVAQRIEFAPQRNETLAKIGAEYAAIGQQDQALELLNQALTLAQDTLHPDGHSLIRIGRQYAIAGFEQQAAEIFEEALDVVVERSCTYYLLCTARNFVYYIQALAFANAGRDWQALEVVESIDRLSGKVSTLSDIADAYFSNGQTNQALAAIDRVAQLVQATNDPEQREEASRLVAYGYVRLQRFDRALQIARTIEDDSDGAAILTAIARGMIQTGNTSSAIDLLEEAFDRADRLVP